MQYFTIIKYVRLRLRNFSKGLLRKIPWKLLAAIVTALQALAWLLGGFWSGLPYVAAAVWHFLWDDGVRPWLKSEIISEVQKGESPILDAVYVLEFYDRRKMRLFEEVIEGSGQKLASSQVVGPQHMLEQRGESLRPRNVEISQLSSYIYATYDNSAFVTLYPWYDGEWNDHVGKTMGFFFSVGNEAVPVEETRKPIDITCHMRSALRQGQGRVKVGVFPAKRNFEGTEIEPIYDPAEYLDGRFEVIAIVIVAGNEKVLNEGETRDCSKI